MWDLKHLKAYISRTLASKFTYRNNESTRN